MPFCIVVPDEDSKKDFMEASLLLHDKISFKHNSDSLVGIYHSHCNDGCNIIVDYKLYSLLEKERNKSFEKFKHKIRKQQNEQS